MLGAAGPGGPFGHAQVRGGTQTEPNPSVLMPVTKDVNARVGSGSTGPLGFLESRTGTTPWAVACVGTHSTQYPPLLLYEDLTQRRVGDGVLTECPF
jgi:hypothetical protein